MSLFSKIRKAALGTLRHTPALRLAVRNVYYGVRTKQYSRFASKASTQPRTILFECFGGKQFGCSPRAFYEEILADDRFNGYRLIWAFDANTIDRYRYHALISERAETVARGTKEYLKACAEAKYWIFNNRVAEYITPKADQIYVQCWHGTPLKRLGFDVTIETKSALNTASELADRFSLDSKKWSYLISPSSYTSLHLADAFGLPEKRRKAVIVEEGYPRNDRIVRTCNNSELLDNSITAFRNEMHIPAGKKLLLYAPTWRDDSFQAGSGYVMESALLDFETLQKELGNEWVVLFRAHYYIANRFDFSSYDGFVYDVSNFADINDLYIVADALLTDYSSVFFDYANTGRPILFFWPDHEHYATDVRGFYLTLDELPGPHCFTNEEVIEAIKNLPKYDQAYGTGYKEFRRQFCPKDDGHASQRALAKIISTN